MYLKDLMFDPDSPILDFYPEEFEQDLNGKKQEWEAIVKIPFIDENRLLRAMASREHRLTPGERRRNGFGTSTKFSFSTGEPTVYPSSLPDFFPPIYRCTCIMEPFDLPTLDGLHLIPGLCDGVVLGAQALAGFPSLDTLPYTAQLGFHGVNVHGSESRNKSMVVHIQNPHENSKIEEIAKEMVGKRTFVGWPFLLEGRVVAVSDSLFKYEEMVVVPGAAPKIVANPHASQALSHWKMKAERIEQMYSKKCGVITGDVEVLAHVQPLKGMKRLESGAFVKDYEDPDKEIEQAVQMVISQVASEDPRFLEKDPPPLSEEFPDGCKIFFLGEHAYGVAAQVASTTNDTLSVVLAFFPSDKAENDNFKAIVQNRVSQQYYPSFKAANALRISGRALSKITSSFMILTSDSSKNNLGLSLKFEAKSLKVVDYSRKDGHYWEFSKKTIDLIREYKEKFPEVFQVLDQNGDEMARASDIFGEEDADARVREVKSWLNSKGVRDFEPVSLFADQLTKETVREVEEYADSINKNRSSAAIKKAMVKNIPRHAVLKPSHAIYRLQNQHFTLGDRVTMVQDSGGVPLSIKGVVIGLGSKTMDVIWDVPFMSGVTLGDRCSQYRGSSVHFNSCLNLSNPQFIASTHPKSAPPPRPNVPFRPRGGPHPAIRPRPYMPAAAGFRPAPGPQRQPPVSIMTNPHRGRGGFANGRGAVPPGGSYGSAAASVPVTATSNQPKNVNHNGRGGSTGRRSPNGHHAPAPAPAPATTSQPSNHNVVAYSGSNNEDDETTTEPHPGARPQGGGPHGRGRFPHAPRGGFHGTRGRGFAPGFDRGGRGRGGFRGRARGGVSVPPLQSS
ncbi:hypothetical protein BS17DRAFT_344744 [Gyrodon lividus]|nr:hypothetical protein BS17DRAFT_344744 [Gyrodon lividus]